MTESHEPEYVQPPIRVDGPITLADYDPSWPEQYLREEARIRAALGARALEVEHVGSTSIPGLSAKPIIDIVLVVSDPANEADYVSHLESAGYLLRHREPDWHEHRLLKGSDPPVNLHVFPPANVEVQRMLLFRDTLVADARERHRYESAKRELASRTWAYVQDYADAKAPIVEDILARARTG